MKMAEKSINLLFGDYEQKGLYLILPDATRLVLTRENIEKLTSEYWEDSTKIPPEVKEAADFQRCPDICPLRQEKGFCNALAPILPLLDVVDNYVSFDKVIAIFRGDEKEILHISDTTMQEALKYVSILSLTQYCQFGREYGKYYWGIVPLMSPKEMAGRLYLNIYYLHKGEKEGIDKFIAKFKKEITITSQNQIKRLNLICKRDAFMNAFVNTQITTEFLSMDMDRVLKESFERFGFG